MRTIEYATAFKRDFKRVRSSPRHKDIESILSDVLRRLISDEVLEMGQRDHALTGNWSGYRECHLKPDLLLIYRKPDSGTLRLARLGSHSELFR
ncbi:RelE_StbE, addiction module toxin, RelE/StbE family [Burkholderiales bacterium]